MSSLGMGETSKPRYPIGGYDTGRDIPIPNDWRELYERFKLLDEAESLSKMEAKESKPLIQRVPTLLTDNKNFKKCFEPRLISIGPIHHGKSEIMEREKLKLSLAKLFLSENGNNRKDNICFQILGKIEIFKRCYNDMIWKEKEYTKPELAWMLFVDGCALLQFISCYVYDEFYKFDIDSRHVDFLLQDLLMLENQLPFGVLNMLMDRKKLWLLIYRFIKRIVDNESIWWWMDEKDVGESKPVEANYLLELIWRKFVDPKLRGVRKGKDELLRLMDPSDKRTDDNNRDYTECIQDPYSDSDELFFEQLYGGCVKKCKRVFDPLRGPCTMVRDYLYDFCLKILYGGGDNSNRRKSLWSPSYSVKELKAAGIQLKPTHSRHLLDTSFSYGLLLGELKIPPLFVGDQEKILFLNMIAFEMCHFKNKFVVSSYISFLNSLIAHENDVTDLRSAQVLVNYLSSDEEVVKLFREMASNLIVDPEIYKDTKSEIDEYVNDSRRKTYLSWFTEAMQVYFRSPWTTIASFTVAFGLVLTLIQTIYAVLSHKSPGH